MVRAYLCLLVSVLNIYKSSHFRLTAHFIMFSDLYKALNCFFVFEVHQSNKLLSKSVVVSEGFVNVSKKCCFIVFYKTTSV